MADGFNATQGTGTTVATDDIAGVHYQRVKLSQGADGSATDVSSAAPLNVTLANTGANATAVKVDGSAVTQPVSGTVAISGSVAVTGAGGTEYTEDAASAADPVGGANILVRADTPATVTTTDGDNVAQRGTNYGAAYVQILDNGNKASIDTAGADNESNTSSRLNVRSHNSVFDGTTWDRMKGDSTDGVLVNLGANNDVTVTGTITANAGTGTMAVSNTVLSVVGGGTEATAQRVTIASDSTGVLSVDDNGGSLTVDGTVTANAGTGTFAVSMATNTPVGNVAHDSVDSGAPIKTGGRARTTEVTAVASDDRVDSIHDKVGKQIVLPYAIPESFVSGAITTAMTGTTSTSLVAAPGAGLRNYITTIIVSNSHATVGTDVIIQDGSGGTTLMTIPAAAVYGGAVINLPVPLRQPTTATAIFCANVTTGASTKVSAVGYTGA